MAERMLTESRRHRQQVELLTHRIAEIEKAIPELNGRAKLPTATDDDRYALRAAEASLRLTRRQRRDLQGDYWINVLERAGVFPNYTLLDEGVTLEVGLSWLDPDTGTYETETLAFRRGAAVALGELAPGATFYAGGHQVRVNAVDLGNRGEAVRTWALCPTCGHGADVTERAAPLTCPRCADPAIAEADQRLDVVELTRVSSTMRRDEATIGDDRDDRIRERFEQVVLADFGPTDVHREWWVEDLGFGVRYVRNLGLRWLNLGRANGLGATRRIAGREVAAELFRLCAECGQLDTRTGANSRYDHRPWCSLRDATAEQNRALALSRSLRTEGLLLRLPPMISLGSAFTVPSLAAAIKLGLREHIGGAPDHLALETVADPVPTPGSGDREALLLHDLVPGGTGYLADLSEPETLRSVLVAAHAVVSSCSCRGTGRLACPQCLLPFAGPGQLGSVSRAEAERQLDAILHPEGSSGSEEGVGGIWVITTSPPLDFDPESKMEQKFRAALRDRLGVLGATVTATPQTTGERWEMTVGGRAWTLEPQVLVGNCRPDFVLRCADPRVPSAAIFCDGRHYHSSPQHNRLADDAIKRRGLREAGMLVVSLAWADLEGGSPEPAWYDPAAAQIVMEQGSVGLRPAHLELIRGSALDLLVAWIGSPDPDGLRAIGRAVPFLLARRATVDGEVTADDGLARTAGSLLGDGELPPPDGDPSSAWAWRSGSIVALSRLRPDAADADIAVVLDDSETAMDDGLGAAWPTWLRLGNLLGLRDLGTEITVSSLAAVSAAPVSSTDATAIPAGWDAVVAEAGEAERAFLTDLARRDVAVPEYGPEIDGIPLGPSWMTEKVTLDVDLEDAEVDALRDRGWTVVTMDIEQVRDALRTARA